MINIQNSRIVFYQDGSGATKNVTVYFDFDPATKKMYVVPLPFFVRKAATGEPIFSLTRYKKSDQRTYGKCVFDVELKVPDEARKAVQQELPDYVFAQFDWVSAMAFFNYSVPGEQIELAATPSMYGENKVTFTVDLSSEDAVKTFIDAFHSNAGTVSPFRVQYQLSALSTLPSVEATVSYDAAIAIEYEKQTQQKKTPGAIRIR